MKERVQIIRIHLATNDELTTNENIRNIFLNGDSTTPAVTMMLIPIGVSRLEQTRLQPSENELPHKPNTRQQTDRMPGDTTSALSRRSLLNLSSVERTIRIILIVLSYFTQCRKSTGTGLVRRQEYSICTYCVEELPLLLHSAENPLGQAWCEDRNTAFVRTVSKNSNRSKMLH